MPEISANGVADGLLWTLNGTGGLEAYAATPLGLGTLLYASTQDASRDQAPGYVKFTVPVIDNGQVLVAGNGGIASYGILSGNSGGTLVGPSGTITTLLPAFTWTAVTGVTNYEVLVTNQSTGQMMSATVAGTTWTPSQPLMLGDHYLWSVGAIGTGGTITWSTPLTFTIATVTSIGPSGIISTLLPTFSWNGVTGVSDYEVQLYDQTTGQIVHAPSSPALPGRRANRSTWETNTSWWVGVVVAWPITRLRGTARCGFHDRPDADRSERHHHDGAADFPKTERRQPQREQI